MCGGAVHAFDRFDSGAERCSFHKGLLSHLPQVKTFTQRGTTVGRPSVDNL